MSSEVRESASHLQDKISSVHSDSNIKAYHEGIHYSKRLNNNFDDEEVDSDLLQHPVVTTLNYWL